MVKLERRNSRNDASRGGGSARKMEDTISKEGEKSGRRGGLFFSPRGARDLAKREKIYPTAEADN